MHDMKILRMSRVFTIQLLQPDNIKKDNAWKVEVVEHSKNTAQDNSDESIHPLHISCTVA